jgi:cell division protein FtsL
MTDTQLLSIAVMVLAVMAGALFNNHRIGDVRKRIDDMRELLRAEMSKNQNEVLHKVADLDTRLTRIEERLTLR